MNLKQPIEIKKNGNITATNLDPYIPKTDKIKKREPINIVYAIISTYCSYFLFLGKI